MHFQQLFPMGMLGLRKGGLLQRPALLLAVKRLTTEVAWLEKPFPSSFNFQMLSSSLGFSILCLHLISARSFLTPMSLALCGESELVA